MSTAGEQSEMERRGQTLYSYHDSQQLPEDAAYELIRGHLVMSPSPSVEHHRIVRRLIRTLDTYLEEREAGEAFVAPLDVHLSDESVVHPDVLHLSPNPTDRIKTEEVAGAPDLIVEVVTPSTSYRDCTEKKKLYAAHGVREYWIVNPDTETVEVFQNTDEGYVRYARTAESGAVRSVLVNDLTIDLNVLFQ